jgi:hypothetical protein
MVYDKDKFEQQKQEEYVKWLYKKRKEIIKTIDILQKTLKDIDQKIKENV